MSSKFLRSATALVVVSAVAAAQGDDCTTATVLAGGGSGVVQTTPIATTGFVLAGPVASCNGLVDGADGFYSFFATVSGTATFSTCGTSTIAPGGSSGGVDSYIAVYDAAGGCPITGAELGCNDDGGGCFGPSEVTVAVTAGNSYYVQVGDWATSGPITGTLAYVENAVIAAPNDTPAGAILVVGPAAVADNNSASLVDGPLPACGAPSDDLWYYYVPTATGTATLTTCSASGGGAGNATGVPNNDTVIGVWADFGGAPGAAISCDDDSCTSTGLATTLNIAITAGVGVYVSVSGWGGTPSGGAYVLEFTESTVTGPPNDTPAGATPVFGPAATVPDDNTPSLVDGPLGACGAMGKDLWYYYTPAQTGLLMVTTCSANGGFTGNIAGIGDSVLAAFNDVGGAPGAQIACNDDNCSSTGLASTISFPVTAGVGLFVSAGGFASSTGTYVIDFSESLPPVNDDCAGALPITVGVPVTGNNIAATTSSPTGSCQMTGDLWYSLVVPCTGGTLVLDTCGSTLDTTLSVWDNCGGIELGCNDQAANGPCAFTNQSYLEVTGLSAGQVVYIAVGGWLGGTGNFTLNARCDYVHLWTSPAGAGSIQLENVDGPANALAFSAITLDLVHPGLPANQTFPNGWFFGVPMGFPELYQQITWPGGLPFTGILDANGYLFNFALPAGTTSGLAGIATVWSVGVAFDPLTGFATVSDTTDPTAFAL